MCGMMAGSANFVPGFNPVSRAVFGNAASKGGSPSTNQDSSEFERLIRSGSPSPETTPDSVPQTAANCLSDSGAPLLSTVSEGSSGVADQSPAAPVSFRIRSANSSTPAARRYRSRPANSSDDSRPVPQGTRAASGSIKGDPPPRNKPLAKPELAPVPEVPGPFLALAIAPVPPIYLRYPILQASTASPDGNRTESPSIGGENPGISDTSVPPAVTEPALSIAISDVFTARGVAASVNQAEIAAPGSVRLNSGGRRSSAPAGHPGPANDLRAVPDIEAQENAAETESTGALPPLPAGTADGAYTEAGQPITMTSREWNGMSSQLPDHQTTLGPAADVETGLSPSQVAPEIQVQQAAVSIAGLRTGDPGGTALRRTTTSEAMPLESDGRGDRGFSQAYDSTAEQAVTSFRTEGARAKTEIPTVGRSDLAVLPEKPTKQVQALSLDLAPEGAPQVRVRLREYGGDVRITVHSTDPVLERNLRSDASMLGERLVAAGYDARTSASSADNEHGGANRNLRQPERRRERPAAFLVPEPDELKLSAGVTS